MDTIELQDLPGNSPAPNSEDISDQPLADTVVSLWTWSSASVLLLLASCLVFYPRLLLFISESASMSERRTALTPLESFLAIQFGIWLSAIALALVLNVPSSVPPVLTPQQNATSQPLLGPVTLASIITSFLAYNTKTVGPLASIVFVASGFTGLWGLWTIVFGETSSVSRKTGADKHTSSFIFGNKAAASEQKKRWKKERKGEAKPL